MALIIDRVDKILAITNPASAESAAGRNEDYLENSTKQAKTCLSENARRQIKDYECQIDQMVYELCVFCSSLTQTINSHPPSPKNIAYWTVFQVDLIRRIDNSLFL